MESRPASERIHRFEALCRDNGLPITVQRRVLIDAIVRTDTHPTAEELFEHARCVLPDISRTTVYRILDTFVRLGLVSRVPHPRGATRFDGNVDPHHHAVCTACSRVFDITGPRLQDLPRPRDLPEGFEYSGCAVLYLGRCLSCRKQGMN
jgi:Fur family peroxide stress response transcriptional regulator